MQKMNSMTPQQFSTILINWHSQHGRKNLPWQKKTTPYRVWLSEIMLQQTQVSTVIPYFNRFIKRFPSVKSLAESSIDEILSLWSGLGYYARARNLHRTAQIISWQYHNSFPKNLDILTSLPGIGRSTAGAILAISYNIPAPILDGNVKRVLTRYYAIEGWPDASLISKKLWHLAETLTPKNNVNIYTQAIMDLGATVCSRTNPNCSVCPFNRHCKAHQTHQEALFPTKKTIKNLPSKHTFMLILHNNKGQILLEKRPPVGIWGGLWCFPECDDENKIQQICEQKFNRKIIEIDSLPSFRHTFSHFHLWITPLLIKTTKNSWIIMDDTKRSWYYPETSKHIGLPRPVIDLVTKIAETKKNDKKSSLRCSQSRNRRLRTASLSRTPGRKNLPDNIKRSMGTMASSSNTTRK